MRSSPKGRILDATVIEALLHPDAPMDHGTLASLADWSPSAFPHALLHALPLLPPGAYGADVLTPLVSSADVIEPLTRSAREALEADGTADADVSLMDLRPGTIVVDPLGRALFDPPVDLPLIATGLIREHVAWVPRPEATTAPSVTAAEPDHGLVASVERAVRALPPADRLRLRDPHGAILPETAHALARLADAPRLTLWIEDAHGLALAAARLAIAGPNGPLVRSTLLGIGPRTGAARTELLLDPHAAAALRPVAERLALMTGRPIAAHHPLWGAARERVAEPDRIDGDDVEWNPATASVLLGRYLDEWGLDVSEEARAGLERTLLGRLRPGERPDAATLYAFVATHLDLAALAARPEGSDP